MFTAYLVVSILLAVALLGSAAADFLRFKPILVNMARLGVPESLLATLGAVKAAGAFGLLVGVVAPPIGIAAAVGVILFFGCAVAVHHRGRDYSAANGFALAIAFGLVGAASLTLGVASA